MSHQPTQILIQVVAHLSATRAWASTGELGTPLTHVSRPTLTRCLDELARRRWVLTHQQRGVSYWMVGPELQVLGQAWRARWVAEAAIIVDLLLDQLQPPHVATPPPSVRLPRAQPSGEPDHQGIGHVCDLLTALAHHGLWTTVGEVADAVDIHRQTAGEIVDTLAAARWAIQDLGRVALTTRFPGHCLAPALRTAQGAHDTQALLTAHLAALQERTP